MTVLRQESYSTTSFAKLHFWFWWCGPLPPSQAHTLMIRRLVKICFVSWKFSYTLKQLQITNPGIKPKKHSVCLQEYVAYLPPILGIGRCDHYNTIIQYNNLQTNISARRLPSRTSCQLWLFRYFTCHYYAPYTRPEFPMEKRPTERPTEKLRICSRSISVGNPDRKSLMGPTNSQDFRTNAGPLPINEWMAWEMSTSYTNHTCTSSRSR